MSEEINEAPAVELVGDSEEQAKAEKKAAMGEKTVSRRNLIAGVAAGIVGGALVGVGGTVVAKNSMDASDAPGSARYTRIELNETIPFYDQEHPAGVGDNAQRHGVFAMYNMRDTATAQDLQILLATWTASIGLMMSGQPVGDIRPDFSDSSVPKDGGEAYEIDPASLTVTLGFGPTLFDDRFGISSFKPEALEELPRITDDRMEASEQGSDLGLYICANDRQCVFHALHVLTRQAMKYANLIHTIDGFMPVRQSGQQPTPRDLFGFKDGTTNPVEDQELEDFVYVNGGDQEWMEGGSYMIYRRTITQLEAWDNKRISEQERLVGRRKDNGAPLSNPDGDEFDLPDFEATDEDGNLLIDPNSHVAITSDIRLGFKVLRRGYNYWDGLDSSGNQHCGFLNTVFVNDPYNFYKLRDDMGKYDILNEYYFDDKSATYAVAQSPKTGHYIGQEFFE